MAVSVDRLRKSTGGQQKLGVNEADMFKILSLAGGGLRGAFAIGLLAELEERLKRPIGEYFDLIAGTSTGSITACALCQGMAARDVEDFYHRYSSQIFKPREPYVPKTALRPVYAFLKSVLARKIDANADHFFQSRYCPFSLNDALEMGFGDILDNLVHPTAHKVRELHFDYRLESFQ